MQLLYQIFLHPSGERCDEFRLYPSGCTNSQKSIFINQHEQANPCIYQVPCILYDKTEDFIEVKRGCESTIDFGQTPIRFLVLCLWLDHKPFPSQSSNVFDRKPLRQCIDKVRKASSINTISLQVAQRVYYDSPDSAPTNTAK